MFLHKLRFFFKHSFLSLLSFHWSSLILFCILALSIIFGVAAISNMRQQNNEFRLFFLVFNCQRSISNINFLYLVNSSNDKSTRIFADATCLAGSLPIRWASCLLHASRTVNFPYREETGCEGASHMMASLEWHIKRLLTWHLKRQMLQDHFTLNMCSVLALLPRQNFLSSFPARKWILAEIQLL